MMVLDVSELNDLFLEAAETDRRLPPAIKKQKMSSWVDYLPSWQAYNRAPQKTSLAKATPLQVDRYDLAITLTLWLKEADRKLVWAVALSAAFRYRGAQWTKIARILGYKDKRIVKRKYETALVKLYYIQKKISQMS
tara:strand:- start:203 stop:613 length:411 start_codon:yes stop_codon:yes gene_type:complete